MNLLDIRNLKTVAKWETIARRDPVVQPYAQKSAFGKSQGADLYLRGYEKGISDAQRGNLAASRS